MDVSSKVFTFTMLAVAVAISAASPIRHIDLFKESLIGLQSTHNAIYSSIKEARFRADTVLPPHTVSGMEAITSYLLQLEQKTISEPDGVYPLHYHCLKIFGNAFERLAAKEMALLDDEEYPSFYEEVEQIRRKLNISLQHLSTLMHHSNIPIDADLEFSVTLSDSVVDGRLCKRQCQLEENLYIHQRFNHYIDLAHNNIIDLKVRLGS